MLGGDGKRALYDYWHDKVHLSNLKLIGAMDHVPCQVLRYVFARGLRQMLGRSKSILFSCIRRCQSLHKKNHPSRGMEVSLLQLYVPAETMSLYKTGGCLAGRKMNN